jgi:signal transduction histidine kinase
LPDALEDENAVITYITTEQEPLIRGEFRHKYGHLYVEGHVLDSFKAAVQLTLDETLKAGVIIPLWRKKNLIGFMALGEKLSGDHYTDRDISLLETIANQMVVVLENTRLYEQMLNGERLRVLGSMSASIAHEIRNPLAAIKTFIQMLPDKYNQTEFRARFNEIVPSEIERLTRITGDLLTFARPSPPALGATDINSTLERVVTLLANQLRKKTIEVVRQFGEVPTIQADSQQLTQVFMNLMLNSIQASSEGGKIILTTSAKAGNENGEAGKPKIFISVRDEGSGIRAKVMPNIFEPFFTTKHEGSGLGLATSKRIAVAHQGDIYVDSIEGKGANFVVILPVKPDENVFQPFNEIQDGQTDSALI